MARNLSLTRNHPLRTVDLGRLTIRLGHLQRKEWGYFDGRSGAHCGGKAYSYLRGSWGKSFPGGAGKNRRGHRERVELVIVLSILRKNTWF